MARSLEKRLTMLEQAFARVDRRKCHDNVVNDIQNPAERQVYDVVLALWEQAYERKAFDAFHSVCIPVRRITDLTMGQVNANDVLQALEHLDRRIVRTTAGLGRTEYACESRLLMVTSRSRADRPEDVLVWIDLPAWRLAKQKGAA